MVFTAFSVALHLVIGLGLALLLNMRINATFRSLARGLADRALAARADGRRA